MKGLPKDRTVTHQPHPLKMAMSKVSHVMNLSLVLSLDIGMYTDTSVAALISIKHGWDKSVVQFVWDFSVGMSKIFIYLTATTAHQ